MKTIALTVILTVAFALATRASEPQSLYLQRYNSLPKPTGLITEENMYRMNKTGNVLMGVSTIPALTGLVLVISGAIHQNEYGYTEYYYDGKFYTGVGMIAGSVVMFATGAAFAIISNKLIYKRKRNYYRSY
jgi:hypothetical protein